MGNGTFCRKCDCRRFHLPPVKGKYKPSLFILALLAVSLACGATLPKEQVRLKVPTQLPTAQPTHLLIGVTPVVLHGVVTADILNIRKLPTTDSVSLGVLHNGTVVEIGAIVVNNNPNCRAWYPYSGGWICADFVEVR
jgi:hypothetical protein